jgi:nucleotide-binding universal stress UspA family protein
MIASTVWLRNDVSGRGGNVMPPKNILVPVDFSEPSKKAVTYGLTLAHQFHAKLIVAHIVPEASALVYAFPTDTSTIEEEQEMRARVEIANIVPAAYDSGVDVQTMVKTGDAQQQLLGIIKNEAVDLVVMGTHGRRYLGRWFLGSVTERMLRQVPVPIMTVSHVEPEEHAVGLVSFKRILYASDLRESSNSGLEYAIELACGTGAKLTIAHVVYYPDRMLWSPPGIGNFEDERVESLRDIQKRVADVLGHQPPREVEIEIAVVEGKPSEKILEIAAAQDIDIVVINLQSKTLLERAFVGSTAERVVRLAGIPVLSIPAAGGLSTVTDDSLEASVTK